MKNMTLFDLLAAFGKTKSRPSSMAEIEAFDDDQVAGFLKKDGVK